MIVCKKNYVNYLDDFLNKTLLQVFLYIRSDAFERIQSNGKETASPADTEETAITAISTTWT